MAEDNDTGAQITKRDDTEILLVEDNPNDAELTIHAFRRNGFTGLIHLTRDGAEALDFLFRKGLFQNSGDLRLKMVLLDLKLPKINGLEVLRALRSDEKTRTIPVVILTSSNEERDIREAYASGADNYLVKAVDFNLFFEDIKTLQSSWLAVNGPSRPRTEQP